MATTPARQFQRRDTAANWTAANSVLGPGEIGLETDTGQLKIGSNVTWNETDYLVNSTLPTATTIARGVVKVGKYMTINGSDQLSPVDALVRLGEYQWKGAAFTPPFSGGSATVAVDAASPASATLLGISSTNRDGSSVYGIFDTMSVGDTITVTQSSSAANRMRFRVTAALDAGPLSYYDIPVELISSSGSEPADNAYVIVEWNAGIDSATFANATHYHNATTDLTSGTVPIARLPIATNSTLGVAKFSTGLSIDANGTVTSTGISSYTSGVFIDAADYGVVQDNSTDSRAALQSALDAIKTSGGTVFLKGNNKNPDAYYLSGPVFFNGSNQRLLGAGTDSTYISTLGSAIVTGPEPYYWPSATSYVDTDTSGTVACRDGSDKFIMDSRFRVQITQFQSGGTYGAGGSGQPALELGSSPGGYYGYRTRGVSKVHFPGHPLATGAKKTGVSTISGWEMNTAFTLNLIYFAHGAKVNGGLLGVGQSGWPDPWHLTGNGTDFVFSLAMTNDKLIDRTQISYTWPQPAANGLHRISIQLDLTPGAERLDIWQDRVLVATTPYIVPVNNWITTLVADRLQAPYNIISPWQHMDFTLGSDRYEIGQSMQSGSQTDYTIVGFAGFSELLFDVSGALGTVGATLTRLDAATVTDDNTVLPTSTVYNNSMSCLATTSTSGYDMRTFVGSLFSTWGMITPTNGTPTAAVNAVIEKMEIIGQADHHAGDGITTLPTLGLKIRDVKITTGFFNSIGGFDGLVSYPGFIEGCDLGSEGNQVYVAGFAQMFISDCRFGYIGRRAITSNGSFVKIVNAMVNEYESTAEGFFAAFPGRAVGSGLYASTVLINQEGPRITPKIAAWRYHCSYYVATNDIILDRVDIGAMPGVPSVVIDASFPPGQSYPGIVEVRNTSWAPSGPVLSIRGKAVKGYMDVSRGGCQQEVIQIMDSPFSAFTGFQSETVSPVLTRHNDFYSVPTLGGWLPKSHEVRVIDPPEGGVRVWGVKTAGVEGSNAPPVWEPTEFMPSQNPHALSGNVLSTLHVRVSADNPNVTAPVELWGTFINDSRAKLILERVLNASATFDRTNMQVHYEYGQEVINSSYSGSAVTSSTAITNNSTMWPAASGGSKSNAVAVALADTVVSLSYDEMKRVRASFRLAIGSGSTPLTFCIGRTNYTTKEFLEDPAFNLAIGDIVVANSVRDGSWCTYMQNRILDYVFGNGSPTIPSTFYFGLSSTAIAADGTGGTEISGTGYSRVSLAANSTNFGAHDEYESTWSNKVSIAFGTPGADWGWCRWGFISDASSAGNILAKWPLNRPVYVRNGDDAPTYYPRAMHFQV